MDRCAHFLLLFLLFFTVCLYGWQNDRQAHLFLEGYLDRDVITVAELQLNEFEAERRGALIVRISSSAGDIYEVLELATRIHHLKVKGGVHVVIYIQGRAVGPAAILPFLADELIVTPLVAWGDISYGVGDRIQSSTLQNTIIPFIDPGAKRRATLQHLVSAMIDPYYKLVYGKEGDGDVKVEKNDHSRFGPLILNLKGMESLNLVDKVLSDEAFQRSYVVDGEKEAQISKVSIMDKLSHRLQKYISYSETGNNLIGYLHVGVDLPINQSTYIYVKFALEEFVRRGVRFVVLDLNTPGGEVVSALKIVDLLQKLDIQHHIPVVAFVHDWAVSAGAMLAYSCRFIGIEPNSLMGAAEPVHMGQGGEMISASEKVNSALRAEFANLAMFYGRNPLIAEAMVDKDMILVLRNHEVVQLHSENEVRTAGPDPDVVLIEKGKLLTLNAKQLMSYEVADFEVFPTSLMEITDKEREEKMWPAEKLLIFQQPYLAKIPNAIVIEYRDWRVGFFTFLSLPFVTSLLVIGLIIGFYIEINTPGFGIPGSIGVGCLALIMIASFASQAVHWIEVIILGVGLILLALELFVIPGFGITGILGIVLTVVGLFSLLLPDMGRFNLFNLEILHLVGSFFVERLAWLCGALILSVVIIVILAKLFSNRYFRFSKLILKGEQEAKQGYISGIPREKLPQEGDLGETLTPLRPSGKAHIGDNLFDVSTQGGFVEAHVTVEVIRVEGNQVIVRQLNGRE